MSSDARAAARHPERHRAGGLVTPAWCHPGQVSGAFLDSLYGTLMADAARPDPRLLARGTGVISQESGPRIVEARNAMVFDFLTNPLVAEAEWLWMLDADMVFEPDTLYRLLSAAHPTERPIVGALAFAGGHSDALYPTIYRLTRDEEGRVGVEREMDYPRDQLVKVGATGAACLLVHRSALRRMAVPHPNGFGTFENGAPNPHAWFVEGINAGGRQFGEDIAFCIRAQGCGLPIYVDTRVKVGHVKSTVLDEAAFDRRRAQTGDPLLVTA